MDFSQVQFTIYLMKYKTVPNLLEKSFHENQPLVDQKFS